MVNKSRKNVKLRDWMYMLLIIIFIFVICMWLFGRMYYKMKNGRICEGMLNIDIPDMRLVLKKNFDTDKIYEFDNFLSGDECDMLISHARNKVDDSKVVCKNGISCSSEWRTSRNTFISDDEHSISKKITNKVEDVIGIDRSHFEDLQVVHYTKGQQYKEHFDACIESDIKDCDSDVINSGQRYATFIIYLNDDFTEGETCFPHYFHKNGKCKDLNVFKITPKKGRAALFFNLMPDNITHKPESIHAGLPPSSGEKWMCNKWIRTKPWRKK